MSKCVAKTKAGQPCRSKAVVDGTCLAHAPRNVKDARGFGGPQDGSGRPRKPRPDDVLRERIEADIDRWLAPLEAALGAGKPVVTWDAELGKHEIQYVPDPALGMKALKLALDRVYGRPRQAIELTGKDEGPIEHEVVLDDETRELTGELLRRRARPRK